MDSFSHIIFALVFWVLFSWIMPVDLSVWWFIVGAVVLDVDHFLGAAYSQASDSWSRSERRLTGWQKIGFYPRTFLHSIWGILLLGGVVGWVVNPFHGLALVLGLFMHLVLDSLDEAGIYWLYPYLFIHGPIPCSYREGQERVGMHRYVQYSLFVNFFLCVFLFLGYLFLG